MENIDLKKNVELIYPGDPQFELKIDRMLEKIHQATSKRRLTHAS